MKKKKSKGIESLQSRYGYLFVGYWIFGLLIFFVIPVITSIVYAFSTITIANTGFQLEYVALKNFKEALLENPDYLDNVRNAIGSMFYSLPMIVALSLILAIFLNQQLPGRTVFRVIFFLPVIIASSVVVRLLGDSSLDVAVFDLSTEGTGILNYESFFENLNLPSSITDVLVFFLSNAVSLTWNGGVQTILFLAGLQNIPASLYEVSKIEGANKWEEFWLITIPMLRHILSLVMIYTMIALFTSANNSVMTSSIALMQARDYGVASAMLWFYFVIIIAVMGLFLFLYNRFCVKKWD